MKKILSLALVLMLAMSLATGFTALAEEPTVLTIGGTVGSQEMFDYPYYKKAQEEMNIKIEFISYDKESFAAVLAGGDLPDIVIAYGFTPQVLDSGAALDLAPYVDEYLPNMKNTPAYKDSLAITQAAQDGHIWYLNQTVGTNHLNGGDNLTQRGYVVNWEYYKSIGCPPINNDEDYINVLIEMQKANPVAPDGSPTYLFALCDDDWYTGGFRACFLTDVGVTPWATDYKYYSDIFDNSLVNGYTDLENSPYWHDMEFYNKLWKTGLMDIDVFTQSEEEMDARIVAGHYMGCFANYNDGLMVVPSTGAYIYCNVLALMGQTPTSITFVSKNSDNIETALAFLNYVYDEDFVRETYSGIEGKDWNYDENGVPSLTEESIAGISAGDSYWSDEGDGYGYRIFYFTAYNPGATHSDGYPMSLAQKNDVRTAVQNDLMKDFCEVYGVEHWFDAFTNLGVKDYRNISNSIQTALPEVPMNIQRTLSSCEDVMSAAVPRLIMAETDEEFAEIRDEVLAELADLGEADAWAWYSENWEAPRAMFNEYLNGALVAGGFEPYAAE